MKYSSTKLVNPVTNEVWYCREYQKVTLVDSVEFIKVYKEEQPHRSFLFRKDALRKVIKA